MLNKRCKVKAMTVIKGEKLRLYTYYIGTLPFYSITFFPRRINGMKLYFAYVLSPSCYSCTIYKLCVSLLTSGIKVAPASLPERLTSY